MDILRRFRGNRSGPAGALGTRLLVAFALGSLVGLAAGPRVEVLAPLTAVFVTTLRYLAPLMVAVFVIEALGGRRHTALGPANARAVAAFALMALASAALGVLTGAAWPGISRRPVPVAPLVVPRPAGAADWFGSALTLDLVIVWTVVLAVPLALALGWWHRRHPAGLAGRLHAGATGATRLLTRCVSLLMIYAPIGTFALAALMFGQSGAAAGADLLRVMAAVYTAQVATVAALLCVLAAAGRSPAQVLGDAREALIVALASGSSAVTLPVELRVAEHALAVPPALARTIIPLGVTFSKAGTTAFLGALAAVGLRLTGLEVTAERMALATVASAVAGLVTPPVSGGGFVMLALVFEQCGLPVGWVPLLVGIPFVGKLNTPINALGRMVAVLSSAGPAALPVTPVAPATSAPT
jgi:proton glutamate symport protein